MMTKALENSESSRGIAYGVFGITSSSSVLITDTLGAYLFKKQDRLPFMVPLTVFSLLLILLVTLRIFNQLRI